jgi:hypothetical protein
MPPPANPSKIFFMVPVTLKAVDGLCTTLILGILEGSRASSTRAFSRLAWATLSA